MDIPKLSGLIVLFLLVLALPIISATSITKTETSYNMEMYTFNSSFVQINQSLNGTTIACTGNATYCNWNVNKTLQINTTRYSNDFIYKITLTENGTGNRTAFTQLLNIPKVNYNYGFIEISEVRDKSGNLICSNREVNTTLNTIQCTDILYDGNNSVFLPINLTANSSDYFFAIYGHRRNFALSYYDNSEGNLSNVNGGYASPLTASYSGLDLKYNLYALSMDSDYNGADIYVRKDANRNITLGASAYPHPADREDMTAYINLTFNEILVDNASYSFYFDFQAGGSPTLQGTMTRLNKYSIVGTSGEVILSNCSSICGQAGDCPCLQDKGYIPDNEQINITFNGGNISIYNGSILSHSVNISSAGNNPKLNFYGYCFFDDNNGNNGGGCAASSRTTLINKYSDYIELNKSVSDKSMNWKVIGMNRTGYPINSTLLNISNLYSFWSIPQINNTAQNISVSYTTGINSWFLKQDTYFGELFLYPLFPMTFPIITAYTPANNQNYNNNWTITYNLSCSDGDNSTLYVNITRNNTMIYQNAAYSQGTNQLYTENLSLGNYQWFASCSDGETSAVSSTAYFNVTEVTTYNISYANITTEVTANQFYLNISASPSVSSITAKLFYNTTQYTATKIGNNFNVSVTAPFIATNNTAIPFYWNYTLFYLDGTNTTLLTSTAYQNVTWRDYNAELKIKVFNVFTNDYVSNFTANASYLTEKYSNTTESIISALYPSTTAHSNKSFNLSIYGSSFNSITSNKTITYLTNETLIFYPSISINISLIDEKDNIPFGLNCTSARVYQDDNSSLFDFKNNSVSSTILNITTNKLRVEIGYSSGSYVTRYIDYNLIGNSMRICANKEGITHYEQLIISSRVRPIKVKNIFSNCYVAADYTRFTYQDSYLLKAYTINSLYSLYLDNLILGSIDGTTQSYINLDTLEFKTKGYDLGLSADSLSMINLGNNQTKIDYLNPSNDNLAANITITQMPLNTIVFSSADFANPNNFTIIFDYSTLNNITNNTLFKVEFKRTTSEKTTTQTYYTSPTSSGAGKLRNELAFAISFLMMIFGLTFAVGRLTFGWFGIFIIGGSFAILTFAVGGAWYITFLMVVEIIIGVFVLFNLFNQNSSTLIQS